MDTEIERKPELSFYVGNVEAYEREAKTWESRSKKIVKRYRDMRGDGKQVSRFNILWSNVQTLHPALYDGTPTPNVDRRFEDDEEVNTTVAQILERSATYFVKSNDFDDCMNQAVLDRLLPGRGTCWVRYVPNFKDIQIGGNEEIRAEGTQITDDTTIGDELQQELYSEDVVLDYVHWQDYGHNVCRTWQENRMVWRRVYLSKKEIKERFPETCMVNGQFAVPMDAKALGRKEDDTRESASKSTIYELWDRVTKKVYWFNKDMADFLDSQDDPLQLTGFYPCPKPLYATLANDTMIPTPDFFLYQDQANELDILTARIEMLTRALKVVGVYDASAAGVQRMLSENVDNKLIPVEQWAVFAEKGGLKGVVDYFPIEMVSNVLITLYESRNKIKQDIYEITGISDIVRGQTNAQETATAQQIKGKFATLRLDNMQKEVARFSRDCVRLMTEVIAEHFSLETLKEVSGVRLLTQAEKQQVQMAQQPQIDPMTGQPMPPKPLPEHIEKLMKKPTWEEIEAVLRENGARCFRIDIETDSTIKADQDAEKAARTEFLTAAGGFIQQAAQIPVPELQPLLMQMLQFGVAGFKVGREMETEFKVTMDALKQKAEQPLEPQPDPAIEQAKAQMALKQQESEQTIELKRMESQEMMALKKQESADSLRLKEMELIAKDKLENRKVTLDARTKAPDLAMVDDTMQEEGQASPVTMMMQQMAAQTEQTNQVLLALGKMQAQNTQEIIAAVTRPKKVEIKDASGRVTKTAEVG